MNKIDVGGSEAFNASVPTVRGAHRRKQVHGGRHGRVEPVGRRHYRQLLSRSVLVRGDHHPARRRLRRELHRRHQLQHDHAVGHQSVPRRRQVQLHDPGAGERRRTTPTSCARSCSPACRPKVLAANPDMEPGADIQKMTDVGAWLSGPIVRDKLWFAGTWHDQRHGPALPRRLQPGRHAGDRRQRAVELHRQGVVAGRQERAAVVLHQHPVQAERPFRPGQHARLVRRRRLQAARLQVPDDPPGEVHDADPLQHGVRRRPTAASGPTTRSCRSPR